MDKISIILLALICQLVAAEIGIDSQAGIVPSDDEEIARLTPETKVLSSFCIKSRDLIIGDIKEKTNGVINPLYGWFLHNLKEIGIGALRVSHDAAKRLSDQLSDKIAKNDSTLGDNLNEFLYRGFIDNLKATGDFVSSSFINMIDDLKTSLGPEFLLKGLIGACKQVRAYDQVLKAEFETMKARTVAEGVQVSSNQYEKLNCVTAKRVSGIQRVCSFIDFAMGASDHQFLPIK